MALSLPAHYALYRASAVAAKRPSTFATAKAFVKRIYSKHGLAVNTATFCTLLGAGDYVNQKVQIQWELKKTGTVVQYDWWRTARMSAIGLALGPMNHFWYMFLDRKLPGAALKICAMKIACDQMATPVFATTFIAGVSTMEGQSVTAMLQEYKEKFWKIYVTDAAIWPPMQLVNFALVPSQYRVLCVSAIQLIHNTVLSYIKHEI